MHSFDSHRDDKTEDKVSTIIYDIYDDVLTETSRSPSFNLPSFSAKPPEANRVINILYNYYIIIVTVDCNSKTGEKLINMIVVSETTFHKFLRLLH